LAAVYLAQLHATKKQILLRLQVKLDSVDFKKLDTWIFRQAFFESHLQGFEKAEDHWRIPEQALL